MGGLQTFAGKEGELFPELSRDSNSWQPLSLSLIAS